VSLRDELNRIRADYGRLTIDNVLQDATPETAVLHDRFDWDDEIAGPKWRRHQAHQLIASVRIVYREADEENPAADVRAFHAVRGDNGYHYEPAEEIASDPVLTELVLRDMRREWQQMRRRYGHFTEFIELVHSTLEEGAA
jgi:hypothetical protein